MPEAVRSELAKTGFAATTGVSTVQFENVESFDGIDVAWVVKQHITRVDALVTEKRSRRQTKRAAQESIGLYVGPFAVFRLSRDWPPLIGDLLPYQFWSSERMSEFVVERLDGFPGTQGGTMTARAVYEDHYEDGDLFQSESRRLRCHVIEIADANRIITGLSGKAARIECEDLLEPNSRKLGAQNPKTYFVDDLRYVHWYMLENGWSVPVEGSMVVRANESNGVRKWKARLLTYE